MLRRSSELLFQLVSLLYELLQFDVVVKADVSVQSVVVVIDLLQFSDVSLLIYFSFAACIA